MGKSIEIKNVTVNITKNKRLDDIINYLDVDVTFLEKRIFWYF